jgi:hypothetical protein
MRQRILVDRPFLAPSARGRGSQNCRNGKWLRLNQRYWGMPQADDKRPSGPTDSALDSEKYSETRFGDAPGHDLTG